MDKDKGSGKKGDGKSDAKEDAMLRSAVHYTIYKISEKCAAQFNVQFTKETVLAIADHIFRNMENTGRELELFAKHAKRTKIQPDDVKLLFRNCPDMGPHLEGILRKREQEKREAKPLPAAKATETRPIAVKPAVLAGEAIKSKSRVTEQDSPGDEQEVMDFDSDF